MLGNSLFDLLFDDSYYCYNRMVRDRRPYKIIKEEGRDILIHNINGLGKDDIKVELETIDDRHSYLLLEGFVENKYDKDNPYTVKSRFTVKHNEIEKIEKEIKNGILYIYIYWKKPNKPNIKILDKP